MNLKEMKQVVDMFYEEWDLGKTPSHSKGKICSWIYLFEVLEETEKIVIEKEDDKVIGICGYAKWNSKKHIIKKKFYSLLKNLCIWSPFVKNKKAMYQYSKDYDYTPKELEDYFDGEISILIVNKEYRGKKIGKKMINQIFEYAKNDNIKNREPYKCGNSADEIGYIYEKRLLGNV